jgi:hypothetical protein
MISSLLQVQNFLAMTGTAVPFKPPKQKGAHPPSGNPLMYLLVRGRAEKVLTFLSTFLKWKHVFGAKTGLFFHYLRPKRGGVKVRCFAYIWGKGLKWKSLKSHKIITKPYNANIMYNKSWDRFFSVKFGWNSSTSFWGVVQTRFCVARQKKLIFIQKSFNQKIPRSSSYKL